MIGVFNECWQLGERRNENGVQQFRNKNCGTCTSGYNGTAKVVGFVHFREKVHKGFTEITVVDAQVVCFIRSSLLLYEGADMGLHDHIAGDGRVICAFRIKVGV